MIDTRTTAAPKAQADEQPGERRLVLKGSLATLAALGGIGATSVAFADHASSDAAILNFALNLEYLEAEYYLRATTGAGLTADETSGSRGTQGSVRGGSQVPFQSDAIRQYAVEIATDERAHVNYLRTALADNKVAEPEIDFVDSFNVLAQAAGIGSTFNPFESETNFLIGAYVFEDVGVTAYHGAATLIDSGPILRAASGILAVEAYHAGIIRTIMYQRGLQSFANKISAVRDALDGSIDGSTNNNDQGIRVGGQANLVPADMNAIAFDRTFDQVLGIVYAGGKANNFGFFPSKLNGKIR